jgi:acyl-CoA synthetase (AMP-forming)/AMP-acid ligase II
VLLLLENSIEYAVAVHAVLMAGAVFVPLHPMAKSEKIAFIANDTRAAALLTHALLAPEWAPAIAHSPHLISCRVAGALGGSVTDSRLRAWPADDTAAVAIESRRIDQDLAA